MRAVAVAALVCTLVGAGWSGATGSTGDKRPPVETRQVRAHEDGREHREAVRRLVLERVRRSAVAKLAAYRAATFALQDVMRKPHTLVSGDERWTTSRAYLRWIVTRWRLRLAETLRAYRDPPHKAQWECIHRFEGSWTDPNSPYYGGLQMDLGFQQAYGLALYRAKGTADHWTPLEQMWVAENAYRTRGFWPWPNTARYCGLI